MDRGELVAIKNAMTASEVTPSVVKIDGRGSIIVGQNAYNELELDPDNAVSEFKRWMGNPQHDGFRFRKSGKVLTAAELSAEVLKVLKASASSRFGGEEIRAAVITVPAMFLIPACEDTKAAARLAGIDVGPLLQEPVAAAMAYGYQAENLSGHLLVFDLGGGTFDTTILTAKEGRLVVVGHSGDDKLGGKDYDWALVDFIVSQIIEEFGELGLQRGNAGARRAMAKLKYLAEEAKKTLSLLPNVSVDVNHLGEGYEDIDTAIEITQENLIEATEPLTRRCIDISSRLLSDCHLSNDALASVLVVGGPTIAPYIRTRIKEHFGKAEYRIDPMTVVARGAALFAGTQRMPQSSRTPESSRASRVEVRVAYSPVSSDFDAGVGIVIAPAPNGATVIISRADKGWHSGSITLPSSGKLFTTVVLRAKKANTFEVEVRDATGSRIETTDSTFTITHGLAVAQATTSRALSVALADNQIEVLIPKGAPLPAKGLQKFVTARDVSAGDSTSILKIYLLEGDDPRADRNFGIGVVELKGDELRRTLPTGETVNITYTLDESKTLSAEAVFEFLKEARRMLYKPERPALNSAEIEIELTKERERLKEVRKAVPTASTGDVKNGLAVVEAERETAESEPDSRQKSAQRLIEVKQALDALEKAHEWDLRVVDLHDYQGWTQDLVKSVGTPEQQQRSQKLLSEADSALSARSLGDLRKAIKSLRDLFWEMSYSRDDFWKGHFEKLREGSDYVDPLKAERLKEEGNRAIKRNDIPSLRTIVWELYGLLPTWQQGKLDLRFEDAGLKRVQGS
jgi:molecular chaperone DnaK